MVRANTFVIVAVLLSALTPSAQQRLSSQDVTRGLADALQLLRDQKLDEATAAFQALADASHGLGLAAEEAEALCGLGQSFENQSRYKEAESTLRQSLEMAERLHDDVVIARAALALSRNAEVAGRSAEAVSFANRAVAMYDALQDLKGSAQARLQLLRVQKLSLDEDRTISQRIIEDARRTGDRGLEAYALHHFGDRLFAENRFEEAFETLTRARILYHDADRFADEGTVLNSLGRLYRAHGRLDEALKCQLQALALHERYGTPLELMQSHNAVAVVEQFSGDLTAARDHYERALAIAQRSSSPRIQDFLNANIAQLSYDLGEYAEAARALEDVIARGLDTNTSIRYANLALDYLRLNRPADAVNAANHALAACGDDSYQCINAFDNRAAAYAALNDLPAARADLRNAVDSIERVRSTLVPADLLKQSFQDARRGVYSASIEVAFRQHDARASLETAERVRRPRLPPTPTTSCRSRTVSSRRLWSIGRPTTRCSSGWCRTTGGLRRARSTCRGRG
jgi:tetratricopeptide (TPR) repeat protein